MQLVSQCRIQESDLQRLFCIFRQPEQPTATIIMQSAEQEIIRLALGFKTVIPEWKIHSALEYISLGEVDLAFHILCEYIVEYAPQIGPADYQAIAAINSLIHDRLTKNMLATLKGKIRLPD